MNFKKTAAAFFAVSFTITARAYNQGNIIGAVHYSGIDTYINNYPISAYNLDGRQLICAEDLRNYGFNVEWSQADRSLYITRNEAVTKLTKNDNIKRKVFMANKRAHDIVYSDISVYLNGVPISSYSIDGSMMIPLRAMESVGVVNFSEENNCASLTIEGLSEAEYVPLEADYDSKITIVLDPGHGKDSWQMSDEEKVYSGYEYYNGSWGEWRHWKTNSSSDECHGEGCNYYGNCWYPITNGDRDTEPNINLRNALAAKERLEQMGYNVRMTRSSNEENPSFNNRIAYCFTNNDLSAYPDAACYVCIHSNAGGGRGSAYIEANGSYTQKWVNSSYVSNSNLLGKYMNDRISEQTSLTTYSGGKISGLGYMILFNKSPIPVGYMEIGFYDSSDIEILNREYAEIGNAIADGINDYMWN